MCCYVTSLQSRGSESDVQSTEEIAEVWKEEGEGEFGAVWKKKNKKKKKKKKKGKKKKKNA